MPFPITHLCVADRFLTLRPMPQKEASLFMLASLAPDGVHYRPGFGGADKKVSHLCPVSDERWGRVSENDKWLGLVRDFGRANDLRDPYILGYCVHIIADIFNNRDIWMPYCQKDPADAAKAYQSDFYAEWDKIDTRLYQQQSGDSRIFALLPLAQSRDLPGLAVAHETDAFRHNLLHVSYPAKPPAVTDDCRLVTYAQVSRLIDDAAAFAAQYLI